MKDFSPISIQTLLTICLPYKLIGDVSVNITNVSPISEAKFGSLCFLSPSKKENEILLESTTASVVILSDDINQHPKSNQLYIKVSNPRLVYVKLLRAIFYESNNSGIHPTAIISNKAKIASRVNIGPYCQIGNCEIGEGTVINSHCKIGDGTQIGRNVMIASGVIIGSDGFGYEKDENGKWLKFPHVGGVIIDDNVDIGANTCIDRGTLGDTHIKEGAKIDNLVHIAHNVIVGKNATVIANAMIGGSSIIGDNVWIAPSSTLRDGISIGNSSVVGLAALVTKSVPEKELWAGFPAKFIRPND